MPDVAAILCPVCKRLVRLPLTHRATTRDGVTVRHITLTPQAHQCRPQEDPA